jgi:hypothetical protein
LLQNNSYNSLSYDVKRQALSPTTTYSCMGQQQSNYIFGNGISANNCGWIFYNQTIDLLYQGNDEYANQEISAYNQNYHPKPNDSNNLNYVRWNQTMRHNSLSIWNHALGTANSGNDGSLWQIQASNDLVATPLNDTSYLLGLQSINLDPNWNTTITGIENSHDTNTSRPQLNVSWRRPGEIYSEPNDNISSIPDNNSIQGAKARTGQLQSFKRHNINRSFCL